jgi:DNA polymerase elongation subunit (family B)
VICSRRHSSCLLFFLLFLPLCVARQKAIKICANAVFGFAGSNVSFVFLSRLFSLLISLIYSLCLFLFLSSHQASKIFIAEIAESVIQIGADNLLKQAVWTQQHFHLPVAVIYGDTDSIAVKFPNCDVPTAIKLAKQVRAFLASFAYSHFSLFFVFCTCLPPSLSFFPSFSLFSSLSLFLLPAS